MLQVFTIILNQNVFQNPELFETQVSLSPEQSTLVLNNYLYTMVLNGGNLEPKGLDLNC
jgi:hypothetical protein